jgi:hypothetical protein
VSNSSNRRSIALQIPEDPLLLQAIGRISILYTQLDFVLRMTMQTLAGSKPTSTRKRRERERARGLRKRIRELASKRLGRRDAYRRLDTLLDQCRTASKKRDRYVHALFVGNFDRDEYAMESQRDDWAPSPSLAELTLFAAELFSLAEELDEARSSGFLKEALEAKADR